MSRILLFICLFLAGTTTLCFAQQDPVLGQAGSYAVLASNQINNTNITVVAGDMGISPGTTISNNGEISQAQGVKDLGNSAAATARQDASDAYNSLIQAAPVTTILPKLNMNGSLSGGVYRVSGSAVLDGIFTLDAGGDVNAIYIFIVDGDLNATTSTGAVLLTGGAQSKNIYWLVKNKVNFEPITVFHGNIIANGDITLGRGSNVTGRVISLGGNISLNNNKLFLPTAIQTDLSVQKVADEGEYTVGSEVAYTITVKNDGPSNATNLVLEERIPAGLAFVKTLQASKGTFDEKTNKWTISRLNFNESATLRLVFKIISATNTTNKVVIISNPDNPDPSPDDNNDEDPITVSCPAPALAVTGESSFCAPQLNTTYTVTQVEGAVYSWTATGGITLPGSRNQQTVAANIAGNGSLTATVTDVCGKTYTVTKEVSLFSAPAIPGINGSASVCANSQNLSYTASSEGAETFEWTATGDITIVSGANTATVVVNVGATGGKLKVTAKNGCSPTGVSKEMDVTTITKPAAPAGITGNTELCAGTEGTYTAAAIPGATGYTWKAPQGWTISPTNDPRTVTIKAGETSGNITVTADNNCGSSEAVSLAIKVASKPAAPTITGEAGACVGTTLTYSIADVADATAYTWSVPQGWKIISGQRTTSITVEVGNSAGDVTIVASNKCGDSEAGTLAVKGITAPAIGSITGNTEVCINSGNLTYTLKNAEKGAVYTWNLPQGWTLVKGQGTGTITVNAGTAGGTISVKGKNSCGTSEAGTLAVRITTPPAAPGLITDNSNVCDGLTYSIAAVPGATSYTWSVPSGFTITAGQGTTSIKVKADSPAAAGQVTVVANNASCAGAATSASINVALADGQLSFPKAFSPNGDGQNDTWVITNLLKFPDNEVIIFNRWGAEVYRQKGYQNNWNGNKLGQGTYFYKVSVELCDGVTKEFTGYVTIFR
ncbi:DUF3494 domain-containing protein [Pontibacter sp. 172403-2]|uniref:ice-binding family protein n=1 Tax=Pontibacter rufus TaxID=2791028 RepID=UPI0018AFF02A|nr:ice-binding family protein [Pontibacter sp. 172403-2]MBF9255462.1 DUF3494 domain-containing protein [Pontibacter sp. 172403-2]